MSNLCACEVLFAYKLHTVSNVYELLIKSLLSFWPKTQITLKVYLLSVFDTTVICVLDSEGCQTQVNALSTVPERSVCTSSPQGQRQPLKSKLT